MEFTRKQAEHLLECFGSVPDWDEYEDFTISVIEVTEEQPSHSGPGLYAIFTEYPEEGAIKLGNDENKDECEDCEKSSCDERGC